MQPFSIRCFAILAATMAVVSCVAFRSAEDGALISLLKLVGQLDRDLELRWKCTEIDRWGWSQGVGPIDRAIGIEPVMRGEKWFSQLVVSVISNRVVCADAVLFPCNDQVYRKVQRILRSKGDICSSNGSMRNGVVLEEYSIKSGDKTIHINACYNRSVSNLSFNIFEPSVFTPRPQTFDP